MKIMKVLVIEDNDYKREKVTTFLKEEFEKITIDEAYSYSSGLDKVLSENYDFLVLDMSLPSFDKKDTENGGRFRTYGGKEIARKMKRKKIKTPFAILTHYSSFSDDSGDTSLDSLIQQLREQNEEWFVGAVYYSGAESSWKIQLKEKIQAYV